MPAPEVVVLGHCTLDDLDYKGKSPRRQPGGAAIYAAIGALVWERHVGVVSVVGRDYPLELLRDLCERGVDVGGLRRVDQPTISGGLHYAADGSREYERLDLGYIARMTPDAQAIPEAYLAAPAFHLAPMSFGQQLALARRLPCEAFTSWDTESHYMGSEDPLAASLVAAVSVFCPSIANLRTLFGLPGAGPEELLVQLSTLGATRAALKLGDRGAMVVDEGQARPCWIPAYPVAEVDPTGAGDAFCGGLLAGVLAGETLQAAALYGAVSASFVIETPGAAFPPSFTPAEREKRLTFVRRRLASARASLASPGGLRR